MLIEKLLNRIEKCKNFLIAWYNSESRSVKRRQCVSFTKNLDSSYFFFNQSKTDEGKAFEWYKLVAELGNVFAMNEVARYYFYGVGGIKKDEKQAMKWYEKAKEEENPIYNLFLHCGKESELLVKDEDEILDWAKKLGISIRDRNSVYYEIGYCYQYGKNGLKENEAEAFKWYRKAADAGNVDAMGKVGYFYYYGLGGVKEDKIEAFKWDKKAADGGNSVAMYNLGQDYANGYGVEEDKIEAFKWYRKAADAGFVKALERIKELEK